MLTLEQIKQHLRIDYNDEDALLLQYLKASLSAFEVTTRRILCENQAEFDNLPNGIFINAMIEQGALLLIGHWYSNREAVSEKTLSEIPFGVQALWHPYTYYKF